MNSNKWLAKTEPQEFSWDDLVQNPASCWDGVRNVEARNNLRQMQLADEVFIYHTGKEKRIVGVAEVVKTAYVDPTSTRPIWSAVDLTAKYALAAPVTLASIKADRRFAECLLSRRPRLSVMPISHEHFELILAWAS